MPSDQRKLSIAAAVLAAMEHETTGVVDVVKKMTKEKQPGTANKRAKVKAARKQNKHKK